MSVASFMISLKSGGDMNIKIIGIGGGGCNALNYLIRSRKLKADFIAINSDYRSLRRSKAKKKLILSPNLLNGYGAGGNPDLAQQAAWQSAQAILGLFKKPDWVCILAGLGGGTGTGAAPVVAQIARDAGIQVASVVTLPFRHEGPIRHAQAQEGMELLKSHCDIVLKFSNDQLNLFVDREGLDLREAFALMDEWFSRAAMAVGDLLLYRRILGPKPSEWKTILGKGRSLWVGTGSASGNSRFLKVCEEAIRYPIVEEVQLSKAKKWYPLVVCRSITLGQFNAINGHLLARVPKGVKIIPGIAYDKTMKKDQLRLSLWASAPPEKHKKL